jgi:hypothetical protein
MRFGKKQQDARILSNSMLCSCGNCRDVGSCCSISARISENWKHRQVASEQYCGIVQWGRPFSRPHARNCGTKMFKDKVVQVKINRKFKQMATKSTKL